jgi:hypothetical protein
VPRDGPRSRRPKPRHRPHPITTSISFRLVSEVVSKNGHSTIKRAPK